MKLVRCLFAGCGLLVLAPACYCATEPGTVQVELRGETKTWTEDAAVLETTDDARFQTERYGKQFSYVLRGLPPGTARLKLGFCELKYDAPGKRVFDILVNGKAVFPGFDILKHGEKDEAVTVTTGITVPANGVLEVGFVGKVEQAKLNTLKLYTREWTVDVPAGEGPKVEMASAPPKDAAFLHEVYETCVGKFGSRLCINPRPQRGICRQSAMGHADYNVAYFERNAALYEDPATAVYYAVSCHAADEAGGAPAHDIWYSLPFNGRITPFAQIKQEQSLTTLTYTCRGADLPLEVIYTFRAPFYPGDIKLSVAPYILLDVSVRNLSAEPQAGSVVVGQSARARETVSKVAGGGCHGVLYELPVFGKAARQGWLVDDRSAGGVAAHVGTLTIPAAPRSDARATRDSDGRLALPLVWADAASGLSWEFTLGPRAEATRTLAYVGWVGEPVIEVMRQPYRFKYTDLFKDPFEVARWAFDNREAVDAKVALFESTVHDATASPALKQFLGFAFQSWIQNTFYCSDATGADWFSVWEGCCKFHSTVDVEYNVAPLYFEYWPELMRMTLVEWVGYIHNGILSHDMGMGLEANGMQYGHDMEVEENTNFVLLLWQYWRQTGDVATVKALFPAVDELLEHVTRCDTDGDGFHEEGTYNTIDQGSPAIQYARDQVYLAVRALSAYECGARMAQEIGNADRVARWRQRAALTARTLDDDGWLRDHYAVALNQPSGRQGTGGVQRAGRQGVGDSQPDRRSATPDMAQPATSPAPPADDMEPAATDPGRATTTAGTGANAAGFWEHWTQPANQSSGQGWGMSGQSSSAAPPEGWDGFSIYTTNGMVYPLRTGCELPGVSLRRMRTDVLAATNATLKRYGSPHTNRENNMWVSQNIWRDIAAAYLGIDMVDNVARYWELQKMINRDKRGCFTDVYVYGSDSISLDYYPRGTAAFGLIPAVAGLQVDKVAGLVSVAPLRTPLRVPLLAYADWSTGKVPWLAISTIGGETKVRVDGKVPVAVTTRRSGKPW